MTATLRIIATVLEIVIPAARSLLLPEEVVPWSVTEVVWVMFAISTVTVLQERVWTLQLFVLKISLVRCIVVLIPVVHL